MAAQKYLIICRRQLLNLKTQFKNRMQTILLEHLVSASKIFHFSSQIYTHHQFVAHVPPELSLLIHRWRKIIDTQIL
jgi:hypothetical protein